MPFVFVVLRQDPQKWVVWLAGSRNNSDILERAARSAYLNPLSLPVDYQGTPAEIIQTIQNDMADEQKKTDAENKALAQISENYKAQLRSLYWNVHSTRLLADAIVRFGQLRYTYIIVGWIPPATWKLSSSGSRKFPKTP